MLAHALFVYASLPYIVSGNTKGKDGKGMSYSVVCTLMPWRILSRSGKGSVGCSQTVSVGLGGGSK